MYLGPVPITEALRQAAIRVHTHGSRIRRTVPVMRSRPDPFHLHELTPARSARLIVSAFLLALLTGTGLLMLPPATVAPGGTDLLAARAVATLPLSRLARVPDPVGGLRRADPQTAVTLASLYCVSLGVRIGPPRTPAR